MEAVLQFDTAVQEAVRTVLQGPLTDWIMVFLSTVGDYALLWLIIAAGFILSKKYRKYGFLLCAALVAGFLVSSCVVKPLVGRIRPCTLHPEVPLLIPREEGFSFPSSHTVTGFASAAAIWLAERRWGIAAFAAAAMIGLSRVYLYVHYPTDVLAGAVLGILVTIGLYALQKIDYVSISGEKRRR